MFGVKINASIRLEVVHRCGYSDKHVVKGYRAVVVMVKKNNVGYQLEKP